MKVRIFEQYTENLIEKLECVEVVIRENSVLLVISENSFKNGGDIVRIVSNNNEYIEMDHNLIAYRGRNDGF